MRILIASLLACAMMALATADDPPADSACAADWSEFEGHCFKFFPRPLKWAEAETQCQAIGASLASVHSEVEYQFIQEMIRRITASFPETWIGGSDCQKNNVWLWSDGSVFSYTRWCIGQPDNMGGRQHCIEINSSGDQCWNDVSCSSYLPYVCEMKK